MNQRRTSIFNLASNTLLGIAALSVIGCGDSEIKPPTQAVLHQRTAMPNPKTWSKEDKIAAINKSSIPPDQKKAEIAKVNAGND